VVVNFALVAVGDRVRCGCGGGEVGTWLVGNIDCPKCQDLGPPTSEVNYEKKTYWQCTRSELRNKFHEFPAKHTSGPPGNPAARTGARS